MTPAPDWFRALPTDRLMLELSLWSADLGRLADDVARTESAADLYHVDVADGHFAPALLFFPDLVAAVRKRTAVPLHVHLMVADAVLPDQIDQFADAGADLISVHAENGAVDEALDRIARRGVAAGLVVQLHTPVSKVRPWLDRVHFVTLLGTAIGVKGQDLAPEAEPRLREVRALASAAGRRIVVAADGGIREHTVPALRRAGAETVVMGSLAFAAPDLGARVAWARGLDGGLGAEA